MSEAESLSIGVAGCGSMGLPMAKALLAAGFEVAGFDTRPRDQFGDFVDHMIVSPQDFANETDIVFCVVRDEIQVLDLCFDQQGIFAGPNPPQTLVLSSTVSPRFVFRLADLLPAGTRLLDAPMSGAPKAAIAANLTFMVGGPVADFEKLKPLFSAMGEKIFHLGDLGTGMTAKVLNNFVTASSVAAVRSVLVQARALGLDKDLLLDVIGESSGQSWFGSNFDQINWSGEPYDPANTIGILEKDVRVFIDSLEGEPETFHTAVLEALRALPSELDNK